MHPTVVEDQHLPPAHLPTQGAEPLNEPFRVHGAVKHPGGEHPSRPPSRPRASRACALKGLDNEALPGPEARVDLHGSRFIGKDEIPGSVSRSCRRYSSSLSRASGLSALGETGFFLRLNPIAPR